MLEYWRKPEATKEALLPGRWLRTGDIGRLDDGRLYVNARARDLILRGGENVYPVEIEQRLEAHPDVAGGRRRRRRPRGARPGGEGDRRAESRTARRDPRRSRRGSAERLAAFKVPAHLEIRREPLPRNATGKVLKNVLLGESGEPVPRRVGITASAAEVPMPLHPQTQALLDQFAAAGGVDLTQLPRARRARDLRADVPRARAGAGRLRRRPQRAGPAGAIPVRGSTAPADGARCPASSTSTAAAS